MSLAFANNNLSHFVDYAESSRLEQNDLEVEEILNEIGFFANDDMEAGLFENHSMPYFSYSMPPIYAPVSPEHSSSGSLDRVQSDATIASSLHVENIQSFSVPNPIAAYSAAPAPIIPKPASEPVKSKALQGPKKTAKKDILKTRKRKLDEVPVAPKSSSTISSPKRAARDEDLTEEQLEERRQRNREHAKRSRQRKKSLTSVLQESLDDLKAENAKLREQINARIGADKAESILESRKEKARSDFMAGIQDPGNRIMDDTTLDFLRNLRKNIPNTSSKNQRTN